MPNAREHFSGLWVESAIVLVGTRGTLVIDPIKCAARLRIGILGKNNLNSLSQCQATHLNILDRFATGRMETGSKLELMRREEIWKTQMEEFLQKYPCDKIEGKERKVNYILDFYNGTCLEGLCGIFGDG